uniref:VWFA domain-containing protein n=1 Tax=Heligmosomoides polygyrus TaxID=6339 RepID=A0A183FD52_HELPZ
LYSSPERKRLRIPLGSINDPLRLVKSIRALPFLSGITATGAALQLAELALKARRPDVRTSVVVITDGFSYDDVGGYASQLRGLPNTHVYAVSLGETRLKIRLRFVCVKIQEFAQNSYESQGFESKEKRASKNISNKKCARYLSTKYLRNLARFSSLWEILTTTVGGKFNRSIPVAKKLNSRIRSNFLTYGILKKFNLLLGNCEDSEKSSVRASKRRTYCRLNFMNSIKLFMRYRRV